MALAAVLIQAIFGKKVAWTVGFVGGLALLLPLFVIIAAGVSGMLKDGPGAAADTSSETITAIVNYMAENLPGLVISAIAGAVVGFLLSLLKRLTPRKVRSRVKRAIRM
jgi:predicted membrane-bound mannosyltransferase